jgi:hypothetical protein
MFTCNTSNRSLSRVLAGLAITASFVFVAVAHSIFTSQPML